MTEEERRRLQTRELHSPRSTASVVAAVVVTAVCLYFMFEAALKSIGQDPWIRSPEQWWKWTVGLPGTASPVVLAGLSLLALGLGLYFLLSGLLPGRRARHAMPDPRTVVVVDNGVLAATLARRARVEAGVGPDQVMVIVGRNLAEVQLRPTSGIPVEAASIRAAVEDELAANRIDPLPEVRVQIAESGVVGQ